MVLLCIAVACWFNASWFEPHHYFEEINLDTIHFSYENRDNELWPEFSWIVGIFTGVLCVLVQKGVLFIKRRTLGRDHGLVKFSK